MASSYVCQKCGHCRADDRLRCPLCGAFVSFRPSNLTPPPASVYELPARDGGELASDLLPHGHSHHESFDLEPSGDEATDEEETDLDPFEEEIVPVAIDDVEHDDDARIETGIWNLDEVLGGGFPEIGASYMVSGSPGVGKSTLLLEMLYALGARGVKSALVSNEMPAKLVAKYAGPSRLNLARRYKVPDRLRPMVFASMNIDRTIEIADEHGFQIVVIDSLSACRSPSSKGSMGSATQMTYACGAIVERVQRKGRFSDSEPISIVSIVHETKDGSSAGPNAVKHWFDVALALDHIDPTTLDPTDNQDDPTGYVRLRSPGKNRLGDTKVKGYFKMGKNGLRPYDPDEKPKSPKNTNKRNNRNLKLAG